MEARGQEGQGGFDKTAHNERDFQSLKVNHDMLQQFTDSLKQQLKASEENLQKARNDYFESEQSKKCLESELANSNEEIKSLKNHKLNLVQLLNTKDDEISNLKDTLKSLQSVSKNTNSDLDSSLNEIKLKEIKLSFEENRFNNEKELYAKQICLLNEDIEAKSNELLKLRKETNVSSLQAKMKIEQQSNEINELHLEINRLKASIENKNNAISDLTKKYNELQVQTTQLESNYDKEAETQNDIINLLTKRNKDFEADLIEKSNNINSLQELLQKGCQAHSALESNFEKMKKSYLDDIKELENEKDLLNDELERAKLLISEFNKKCIEDEFEKHFPLAVEKNRQLNLVSLTELYDEFVKNKQDNLKLAEQNTLLEIELSNLKEKLNEEKPILYKNLQDYELVRNKYNELEQQVLQLHSERESLLTEKDEDNRLLNTYKREIDRYKSENQHFQLQIQYLLKSVQESKGFIVQDNSHSFSNQNFFSSNIPMNMVTFKDITDLQERNRQLLQLLTQMNEEIEHNKDDERLLELRREIGEYKQVIENLRNELTNKDELLERNSKQRRLTGDENLSFDASELAIENKTLKEKVDKYVQEIENDRRESMTTIRKLEIDKQNVISENVKLRADVSQLSSDIEAKIEYINDAVSNLEKYQSENVSLRERNIKLNADVENLEKTIIYVKNEVDSLNERLRQHDKNLQLVQSERDLYRNNESNLHNQLAIVKGELENHKKMVYSLKAFQENVSRGENDSVRVWQAQIESLQKSNEYYREKVDKQEDKWKNSVNDFSARINNLQILLDKEKNNNIELQQKCFDFQLKYQEQLNKNAVTASEISNDQSIVISGDVKKQLTGLQSENKMLKGKLSNSESACENLKSLNANLEENLSRLIQSNNEFKSNIDVELQNKFEIISKLNEELNATRNEYEKLVNQKDEAITQLKSSLDTIHSQMQQLNKELCAAKEATRKAEEREQALLDDLNVQTVIANKALADFEAESNRRLGDANAILELELKEKEIEKTLREKESELNNLKEQTQQNTKIWETKRKSLIEQCDALKIRCSSLESVNESLLLQIDQLNNEMIILQSNSTLFSADENGQKEQSNQLLSVIKFLREEMSQLQSKLAKANDENMCIKIENSNFSKAIDNLKKSLEVEKQSAHRLSNLNELNDLVSKAQIVPVLTETNAKMKLEISQLEKRCNELNAKINELEQNEKTVNDMVNRAEAEVVEKQFLKNEIEQWKLKANSLTQQLKSFDSDSVKRLLTEKTTLSKHNQALLNERIKLKQDLEALNNRIKAESEEKTKVFMERDTLKTTSNQLRNLAKKYKEELFKLKTEKSNPIDTIEKEVQCDIKSELVSASPVQTDTKQLLENLQLTLQQKEAENQKLSLNIERIAADNEALRKLANETEDKAKKIAEKAKQRLSESSIDRNNLLKKIEELSQEIAELKAKILDLQTNDEQRLQHMNLLKSQYDSKTTQQEKELQFANKQIDNLKHQLEQPSNSATPNVSSAGSQTSNVLPATFSTRLSVQPQQQQAPAIPIVQAIKTTPTIAAKSLTTSRNSSIGNRPVTMVQPTANTEGTSQLTGLNESQFSLHQANLISPLIAVSSSTSTPSTSSIEISEASTSQITNNIVPFEPLPSTSVLSGNTEDKKRSFDSFDEPSSSNLKKMKVASFEASDLKNEESNSDIEIELQQPTQVEAEREEMEDSALNLENYSHPQNLTMQDDRQDIENEMVEDESTDEENEGTNFEQGGERFYGESDSENEGDEELDDFEENEYDDAQNDDENFDDDVEDEEEDEEEIESNESSEIEVIAIDDSDDEDNGDQNSNSASGMFGDNVSSSHAARDSSHNEQPNQSPPSNDSPTTTNEDGSAAQSGQSSNFQFSTDAPMNASELDSANDPNQLNASESASSTSAANFSNAAQRRPVTWPQSENRPAGIRPARQQQAHPHGPNQRRQLHVRGNRMPLRRGGNPRMPRRF